ncbi:YgaP family membrane protein [Anatilimnocola floriformis]|uniref:YgaP family membrane protein n=1 Tax=Anatilimnocola floriformis TaxID=2948575 RepID=UPI0036F1A1F9
MSTTHSINQAVAEQRHASELSQSSEREGGEQLFEVNVGPSERTLSLVGGTVLLGLGLSRGSMSGLAMLAMGGALAFRGATGHCSVYQSLGKSTAET